MADKNPDKIVKRLRQIQDLPKASIEWAKSNPYFKNHRLGYAKVSDLVKWNTLLNNDEFKQIGHDAWGDVENVNADTFAYDETKDTNPREVIYGTRKPDGTIKLGNGRHRIRALYNDGVEDAQLFILNEGYNNPDLIAAAGSDIGRVKTPEEAQRMIRTIRAIDDITPQTKKSYINVLNNLISGFNKKGTK